MFTIEIDEGHAGCEVIAVYAPKKHDMIGQEVRIFNLRHLEHGNHNPYSFHLVQELDDDYDSWKEEL